MKFKPDHIFCQSTVAICKEAGRFIKREFERFDISKIEYKSFNSIVSYVDKEAEKMLVSGLSALLPQAGFITEEETEKREEKSLKWIIDPLDGTTNFIHGLPCFAVSVGLMQDDKMVVGVVYEINFDECFYTYVDAPSFCNEKKIKVSSAKSLSESLLATGFPYENFAQMDAYLQLLKEFMKTSHGLRRIGSAAVDLAYVACGRFEGFFEYNLNSWDVAAGALIVQNAGGVVTDFTGGGNYIFGGEILAAGHIHGEMLDTIGEHFAV